MSSELTFLALSIGNTRSSLAQFIDGEIQSRDAFPTSETATIVQQAIQSWQGLKDTESQIIIASSNDEASEPILAALADQTSKEIWRIGTDIPPAIGQHLDPETITGVDRLLNAAAAWDIMNQACVIVDAGTCITVDFVDGEGTFHGGAIAPGALMQLNSMHEGTSALPELTFEKPLQEAFGKNTAQAMLQGVYHGIKGMVRQLTEQYAARYGAYPAVIATGGDAELLFEDDDLIDQIIPDLQLKGIEASVRMTLALDEDS